MSEDLLDEIQGDPEFAPVASRSDTSSTLTMKRLFSMVEELNVKFEALGLVLKAMDLVGTSDLYNLAIRYTLKCRRDVATAKEDAVDDIYQKSFDSFMYEARHLGYLPEIKG